MLGSHGLLHTSIIVVRDLGGNELCISLNAQIESPLFDHVGGLRNTQSETWVVPQGQPRPAPVHLFPTLLLRLYAVESASDVDMRRQWGIYRITSFAAQVCSSEVRSFSIASEVTLYASFIHLDIIELVSPSSSSTIYN